MRDGTERSFEVDHLATYTSKSGMCVLLSLDMIGLILLTKELINIVLKPGSTGHRYDTTQFVMLLSYKP